MPSPFRPWIREKFVRLEDGKAQAAFDSTRPLESAALVSTPASLTQKADLWVADATVPKGTTACFLNVRTGPLTASSDSFEVQ